MGAILKFLNDQTTDTINLLAQKSVLKGDLKILKNIIAFNIDIIDYYMITKTVQPMESLKF